MGESKDDERDEEWFKEVYGKEYTGPIKPGSDNARDNSSFKKRSLTEGSIGEHNEDEGPPDPNAVPTDFTSREAKVWEAKSKAIERNWKKKKEEELVCRICGEYGHFSQGCPTTLGINCKQSDLHVEKISVKDRRLKPKIIGTGGATIQGIERDTGCRLKLEENLAAGNGSFFVRISGNNRVMIGKAVAAVKKLLNHSAHDRKPQNAYRSHESHGRGGNPSSMGMQHLAGEQAHHDPNLLPYPGQDSSYYGEGLNGNIGQVESRHQWEPEHQNGSFPYSYKGDRLNLESLNTSKGDYGPEHEPGYDQQFMGQTLEDLEHNFVQETMQLTTELNDAEDEENARHRESIRDIQEQHQQKMATLRTQQGKRREEFLRQEAQFRQQHYQQYQQPVQAGAKYYSYEMGGPMSAGGFGSADRNDMLGGSYGSYRGDEGYRNSSHSYRNSGYESSGMPHSRNQGYDAASYRY